MPVVLFMIFLNGLMMMYMIWYHIKARFDLFQAELARCAKQVSELTAKIDSAAVERTEWAKMILEVKCQLDQALGDRQDYISHGMEIRARPTESAFSKASNNDDEEGPAGEPLRLDQVVVLEETREEEVKMKQLVVDRENELTEKESACRQKQEELLSLKEKNQSELQRIIQRIAELRHSVGEKMSELHDMQKLESESGVRVLEEKHREWVEKEREARLHRTAAESELLKLDSDVGILRSKSQELKGDISRLEREVSDMEEETKQNISSLGPLDTKRRLLTQTYLDRRGTVRVFTRVRPASKGETCLQTPDDHTASLMYKEKRSEMNFDHVFGPECSQADVFYEVESLVESAIDGGSVTLLAYGQTGSGKSYTMYGPSGASATRDLPTNGIIPRSIQQIFKRLAQLDGWKFTVTTQCFEIYNSKIFNLIADERSKAELNHTQCVRKLVDSPESLERILSLASKNRTTRSTNANEHSSRSHFFVKLIIDGSNGDRTTRGELTFVDLAGSEKFDAARSSTQKKEGNAIRTSLLDLKIMLRKIKAGSDVSQHRGSALSYCLRDVITIGKVLVFINVSPESRDASETYGSLAFGKELMSISLN